ncbi:unnamed protein product [Lactuca virosa]|uniref:Uncharacterized protein n=1 Tax=Lactuca virosa TaxID=75947 RepID=A0AAU9NBM0_9ASTR|nr:unnamed protein product [Lactuca virosa]
MKSSIWHQCGSVLSFSPPVFSFNLLVMKLHLIQVCLPCPIKRRHPPGDLEYDLIRTWRWLYSSDEPITVVCKSFRIVRKGLAGVMKEEMTDGKTNIWICNQWFID